MTAGDSPSAIVIGAGVFGASLAEALSSRGWRVTLVERYAPANVRSSSGDLSRLLRCGHGTGSSTDEWYTRSAWNARARWKEIGEEEDRELLLTTGALWFARDEDGWDTRAETLMGELGVPCERLDPARARELLPGLRTDDLSFVLHEPEAGVLRASEAVRTLVRRSLRRGTELVLGTAVPARDAVVVDGERLTADRIVWACGAWLGKLFPEAAPVRATRQEVLYWDAAPERRQGPAWVDWSVAMYGLPDVDGAGLKILSDRPGPPFDPDTSAREPDPAAVAEVRAYIAHRFPELADVRLLRAAVMHYELTPTRGFLVRPLPGQDRSWLMGGGSGHGFKHGPALGDYVADVLEGRAELAEHLLDPAVVRT
jgi:sarcosine oxidase